MDAIDGVAPDAGAGRFESPLDRWIQHALAHAFEGGRQDAQWPGVDASVELDAIDRADVRGGVTIPDDGGERLSTAPAATELNGQARHAWTAQAEALLMRSDARPWHSTAAQQSTLRADMSPLPLLAGESAGDSRGPVSAPSGDGAQPSAAPLVSGDVRDTQAGAASDWDRFNNSHRQG